MDDTYDKTQQLLLKLIQREFPQDLDEQTIKLRFLPYFMRLIGGRFTNTTSSEIEQRDKLLNQVLKISNNNEGQKLRYLELFQRLSRTRQLKSKIQTMQLLYKISIDNGNNASSSNLAIGDSIFKQNYNIKQHQQTMEVENSVNIQNSTMGSTFMKSANNISLTKAQSQLAEICQKIGDKGNKQVDITEKDLIRDILYVFQGINGNYIQYNEKEDAFVVKQNIPVAESVRNLVNRLCEMGWLFKKVSEFLKRTPSGIINQSLHLAIKDELNEYFKLIAILESMNSQTNNQQEFQEEQQSLTIRKLVLWTEEPFERLKWITVIIESVKNLVGNRVISEVNAYSNQGNPAVEEMVHRIMKTVLTPFLKFVNTWVFQGELNDAVGEFFVQEDLNVQQQDFWFHKYKMISHQVPSVIENAYAEKIFNIGKSVNFLRKCCDTNDWQLPLDPIEQEKMSFEENYQYFKNWVNKAFILTNEKLVDVLQKKFKLKLHLQSIKNFLLMGQGEFIQMLMDVLITELNKGAQQVQRHQLLGLLEQAIRSSNAQYCQLEVQQRLDIKLLASSPGDKGWQIFSLDYHVEMPISTIFSPNIMKDYLKIFNYLWKIKRTEHSLSNIWLMHMKNFHLMNSFNNSKKDMNKIYLRCNALRNEMMHFIQNLFNYIMLEVIESSWKNFNDELEKAKDFNDIIETHEKFVQQILEKCLLTKKDDKLKSKLIKIFDIIQRFKYCQDMLITSTQEEYKRRGDYNQQKQMLQKLNEQDNSDHEDQQYQDEEEQSENQKSEYDQSTVKFLELFNKISNEYKQDLVDFLMLLRPNESLRFLSFKLDFNEFYRFKIQKNETMEDNNSILSQQSKYNYLNPQIQQQNYNLQQFSNQSLNVQPGSGQNQQIQTNYLKPQIPIDKNQQEFTQQQQFQQQLFQQQQQTSLNQPSVSQNLMYGQTNLQQQFPQTNLNNQLNDANPKKNLNNFFKENYPQQKLNPNQIQEENKEKDKDFKIFNSIFTQNGNNNINNNQNGIQQQGFLKQKDLNNNFNQDQLGKNNNIVQFSSQNQKKMDEEVIRKQQQQNFIKNNQDNGNDSDHDIL